MSVDSFIFQYVHAHGPITYHGIPRSYTNRGHISESTLMRAGAIFMKYAGPSISDMMETDTEEIYKINYEECDMDVENI